MNSIQAKKINLIEFISKIGLNYNNKNGSEYWFISPLHQEDTPSFKVDNKLNVWYDHGIGKGGNIIDFVVILYNLDFKSALQKISDIWGCVTPLHNQSVTAPGQKIQKLKNISSTTKKSDKVPTIKKVVDLENPSLIKYLESRKIDINIARKYLKEIYWINHK